MTAYLSCFKKKISQIDINFLVETINPIKTMDVKILNVNQGCLAVSFHKNAPLKGKKYFENKEWTAVFSGDLIEKSIPWGLILKDLEKKDYETLNILNGYFSITAYNKKTNKLYIISDRRSQFPVFYLIDNKNIYVSTEMSTFTRLPIKISFNIKWMWEYLFFHYPIGQTTFIENVKRMPPASVLEIDIETGESNNTEYASKFHKKKDLLKGEKALEHAYEVFKDRIPKYFSGSDEIACALTSGWDCRTNLSFCPNPDSVLTYTYGSPGCGDLVEAPKTAKIMAIKHQKIIFDKKFEEKLTSLMFDTIYLSSGMEHITRATLLHVYKKLTDTSEKFPLIISGMFLDGQFRGHGGSALISLDMARMFSTGKKTINEDYWKKIMEDQYDAFKKHIMQVLDKIEKDYGKLSDPETFLSYQLYELAPKYYSGELSIAKHFTTLRVPAWDNDISDLSYSIEYSTLSFSEYQMNYKSKSRKEMILQSYLISKNGGPLTNIPVHGVPPKIVLKGDILYNIIRTKNLLPKVIKKKIQRQKSFPQEDWKKWITDNLKNDIAQLIYDDNSMINKYINPKHVISKRINTTDNLIAKFTTIEIILKLLNNKWINDLESED